MMRRDQRCIMLRNTRGTAARGCRCRGGWSLMHMLAMISLIGIFMLPASRVFMTTQGTIRQSQVGLTEIHQSLSMQRLLRQDAWRGVRFEVLNEQSVRIVFADDTGVTWRFAEAALHRETGETGVTGEVAPSRSWNIKGMAGTFDVTGPTLSLRLTSPENDSPHELHVTSQILLAHALLPSQVQTQKGGQQ